MPKKFLVLAAHLRLMYLFYHNSHQVCRGPTFFSDHLALGEFYGEVEGHYDEVVERMIGLFGVEIASLPTILQLVMKALNGGPGTGTNLEIFQAGLTYENTLLSMVEDLCREITESDKQLVSEIGNRAMVRKYKILQRIGG